jgi:hypothetical protein
MINCQGKQYGQQGFAKAFAPFTFQLQAQNLILNSVQAV